MLCSPSQADHSYISCSFSRRTTQQKWFKLTQSQLFARNKGLEYPQAVRELPELCWGMQCTEVKTTCKRPQCLHRALQVFAFLWATTPAHASCSHSSTLEAQSGASQSHKSRLCIHSLWLLTRSSWPGSCPAGCTAQQRSDWPGSAAPRTVKAFLLIRHC